MQEENRKLAEDNEQYELSNKDKDMPIDNLTKQVRILSGSMNDSQSNLGQVQDTLDEAQNRIHSYEQKMPSLTRALYQSELQKQAAEERIKQLDKQSPSLARKLSNAKEALLLREQTVAEYEDKLQSQQRELDSTHKENDQLSNRTNN